jgi:eukaryotic-like serine/threonine-protein kinase
MNPVDLLRTALSDRYTVLREIGAGGMATVYLAEDLRHARQVALKVLRPELGAVLGVERFLSEIRVTANLQHPHLLPLFDSGEAGGVLYYVMPYVEGESLRARLDRERQLPVAEALRIAVAVAAALDYAHRHGVVHRDLKPENILLHDGQPLVADFGIALAVSNAGGTRVTQTGLSLGTPHYMSPEQATGDRVIDARSDVYSLAALLYEMLTGEPPHTGASVQAIVARVLTETPRSVRVARPAVPEHVDAAIRCALAKLPADRFATARELAEALQDPLRRSLPSATQTVEPLSAGRRRTRRQQLAGAAPWLIAALGLLTGIVGMSTRPPAPAGAAVPAQFTVPLPSGPAGWPAVSADGTVLVFDYISPAGRGLMLRRMDDAAAREIVGADGASTPFLSPDGQYVAFNAGGRLNVLPVSGGRPTVIADVPTNGGSWGRDGSIVFAQRHRLWRTAASGGTPQLIAAIDSVAGELFLTPYHLPDGGIIAAIRQQNNVAVLACIARDGTVRRTDVAGLRPVPLRNGEVAYNTTAGEVRAAPLDSRRCRITGEPVRLLQDVQTVNHGMGLWSASAGLTIAALQGGVEQVELVQVDRSGQATTLLPAASFRMPRISPDGRRIAVEVRGTDILAADIWILDRRIGTLARYTTDGRSSDPLWMPDGGALAWATIRHDTLGYDVVRRRLGSDEPPELLVGGSGDQWPWSWTPDGTTLIYDQRLGGLPLHIMRVEPGSAAGPATVLAAPDRTFRLPRLSPDGRWLAYTSNEAGPTEVYVRPFSGGGLPIRVSSGGGTQPMWSANGRELFYRESRQLMAAEVQPVGDELSIRRRAPLFADSFSLGGSTNYDVLPDGSGFIMLRPVGQERTFTVFANWMPELERQRGRVPDRERRE